jgi:tRNA(fMet)-specific endonuclease VapC
VTKVLPDTNAYTALLAGDEAVLEAIASADTVYMSIFVLGELYSGFLGGHKNVENREILASFLSKATVRILHGTRDTAETFGILKDRLRQKGTPIPINDVWIAAHAMESGSQLVTYDSHFKKVAGLLIWNQI